MVGIIIQTVVGVVGGTLRAAFYIKKLFKYLFAIAMPTTHKANKTDTGIPK